jgi:hypothetical protein
MSNAKTLELRTLDDEELLDVVGGCGDHCDYHHDDDCDRDHDRCDFDFDFSCCFCL